ncbi:hypothetical protein Tco_0579923, partial [Tanacetum coccineum]
ATSSSLSPDWMVSKADPDCKSSSGISLSSESEKC